MDGAFQAVPVAPDVYWVGAIDWTVRNFHGYLTSRGTTYNAFLVRGRSPTLIDTVKAPYYREMMSRIASVIDPAKIEYIVSNHSEMDHSGCLPQTIQAVQPRQVFASKMGQRALANHFHMAPDTIRVVEDGGTLDLGGLTLAFVETRMCHWPDSMVSYLRERELLFSQDAFGMHLAGYERFADEVPRDVLDYESAKYYANILLHLSPFVEKTLAKLQELRLPLSMVAPDHGPIWRRKEDIDRIVGDYARWARQLPTNKAVVVYDTMWGSTEAMARAVGEGLSAGGLRVKMMNLSAAHRSDVATEILEAGALVVGSPTMNNQIFPAVADTMTYLKGLRPRNLATATFGSYGWSGEAPRHLAALLEEMALPPVADPLRVVYVPEERALLQCRELGLLVAQKVSAMLGGTETPAPRTESSPPVPSAPRTCTLRLNGGTAKTKTISVAAGRSLFEALNEAGIRLPTLCGGQGMCGCCRLTVLSGADAPTAVERGHLTPAQMQAGVRLACQIRVSRDMDLRVPEETLHAQPFRARLESVRNLTHDIRHFRFELLEPKQIDFVPGQYLKLRLPQNVDPSCSSRAFSLAGVPSDRRHVELIVRLYPGGICTNWMFHTLQVGQEVRFDGPYGQFGLTDSDAEMVWVAGGSGLSAFWSILRHMAEIRLARPTTLFFGAVARRDLYLQDELRRYEKELSWFRYVPALSQPRSEDAWDGEVGLITDVLARRLPNAAKVEAYLCGPPAMIDAGRNVLREKGVGQERIFFDKFEHP